MHFVLEGHDTAAVGRMRNQRIAAIELDIVTVTRIERHEDGTVKAGQICIYDLKRNPIVLLRRQHALYFYLPRAALDAIADDADARRIGELNYEFGVGSNDHTIVRLGSTILPALSCPERANRLFIDHVMQAVAPD